MTWNSILIWIGSGYLLYYLLNIAYDYARASKVKTAPESQVLTFTEEHPPQLVGSGGQPVKTAAPSPKARPLDAKPEKALSASGIGFSGAVSIADMFNLFKADALQATKAIPY